MSIYYLPAEINDLIAKLLDTYSFLSLKLTNTYWFQLLNCDQYPQNASLKTEQICHLVLTQQQNLFITGPGGCGKTYTIQQLQKRALALNKNIYITATTGIAATNFENGYTIHGFSGLGLGKQTLDQIQTIFYEKHKLPGMNRLRQVDILVIDEVSMLTADILDKVDLVLRLSRVNNKPMGGVQLVLCGDFLQLPPVGGKYIFDSKIWKQLNLIVFNMTIPVRQSNDLKYFRLLTRIRTLTHTQDDISSLQFRVAEYKKLNLDGLLIKPTIIYANNKDVDAINQAEFNKLTTPIDLTVAAYDELFERIETNYRPIYQPTTKISLTVAKSKISTQLSRKCPDTISFRPGAQYILTYNLNIKTGLVNGSRCVYIGNNQLQFLNDTIISIKPRKFFFPVGNNFYLSRLQIPLRLGYAITIHCSQGMSLDSAIIDLKNGIRYNSQIYVALSRVRNLNSLYLVDFDSNKIKASKQALAFYGLNAI